MTHPLNTTVYFSQIRALSDIIITNQSQKINTDTGSVDPVKNFDSYPILSLFFSGLESNPV